MDIPKPSGGVRKLGIPTLVDRLIQQALHQVLSPRFEPTFSSHNYGFRPGRSAGQAVKQAQAYIGEGKRWVVDLDLEKFFDRVNHDVLMSRVSRRIRAYLEEVLRLRINPAKSAVARPWSRVFLGYSVTTRRRPHLRIAAASAQRLRQRIRDQMRRGRGRSLAHTIEDLNPLLRGWMNYFQHAQSLRTIEALDEWLRRRLRCLLWRQWKRPATRARYLRQSGRDATRAWRSAANGRGPWWNVGASHMNAALPTAFLTHLGLASLVATHRRLQSVR